MRKRTVADEATPHAVFVDAAAADPDVHKAACRIAVRCRNIIQVCLREEEWLDADREFYRIAREVLEEFERRPKPCASSRRRRGWKCQ